MNTIYVKINPNAIEHDKILQVANIINNGGIAVVPTETVYGLACRSDSKEAVERLEKLKGERQGKPFAFHLAELSWVDRYFSIDGAQKEELEKFSDLWPGALTLVIKTKKGEKVGLRIPEFEITRFIIQECAVPLFIPSANPSGDLPATTAEEAIFYFWDKVDIIVDGGNVRYGVSSLVLDISLRPPSILREGPPYISLEVKRRLGILNLQESEV